MLGIIVDLLTGFVSMLTGVLPQSPFQDLTLGEATGVALGWLNWLVPVQQMLGIFSLWLTAAVVAGVANFIVKKTLGVVGFAQGGK